MSGTDGTTAPPDEVNADPTELAKFARQARRWWDSDGPMQALHRINPLRLDYIAGRVILQDTAVVDIGCGAGLLSEAMARRGARVLGLDMGREALAAARLHALETGASLTYLESNAEALAAQRPGEFDLATCLEMLEHVPDPASVVHASSALLRPDGDVFFSTINRTAKAMAMMIVGAEHIARMVPAGTHRYEQFIKPSELAGECRRAGLQLVDLTGMVYNPLKNAFMLSGDVSVNYILHARKAH